MEKERMYLPDYRGGSIVNLMSSIGRALGAHSPYSPLRLLPPKEVKRYRNIILFVVDGLGYDYVTSQKNSFLRSQLKGMITSVFPSTTVAAISTFMTGLAPQQHGMTGWFVYVKEMGVISTIFKYAPKWNDSVMFPQEKIDPKKIFRFKPFYNKLKVPSYIIQGNDVNGSVFTRVATGRATKIGHSSIEDAVRKVGRVARKRGRKYVYAYWPKFDGLSHDHGKDSKQVKEQFKEIDDALASCARKMEGTNSLLIVTADHGSIVTKSSERITMSEHQELRDMLSLPLSGDARVAYCYVHPGQTEKFEKYVKENLGEACWMMRSSDLVRRNFFGLFEPSRALLDRIGDYTLIAKGKYAIRDCMLGAKEEFLKGNHSGMSKEEMEVPLIKIDG